ncbi:TIGR03773 family transporter-associated surface protein [Micromonospora sp. CPCC 206061]|uniref:TIGR03773 family transporter-associated surface protein n=1 Tax=Micromonospora sp. CPCC 206061 TaxID=3122410 RepID=UPI002FEF5E47
MRDTTRPRWLAGVLGMLALLAAVPVVTAGSAGAAPPASRQRVVLNDVHADVIHVEYADGALRLRARAGEVPYDVYDPRDVLFQLKDADQVSRYPVPDVPEYAFLGSPGDPVWIAPQTEIDELLFAGWDTESILPGILAGDTVELSLVDVAGPGRVELFENNPAGGPVRMFSGTDPQFRTLNQSVSEHRHANWAFGALGRYELTFEVRATAADGTVLAPARATYTWYVGGTQASDVAPEATRTALSVSPDNPSVGDAVTLSATVSPASATGWIEFFDGTVSLGFGAVSAGQATLSTSALAGGSHTLTARYTPTYANDHQASTSAPVTVVVSGTGTPSSSPSVSPTSTPSGTPSASPTPPPTSTPTPTGSAPSTSQVAATTVSPSPSCTPVTRTSTSTGTTTAAVLAQGHVDYAARLSGGQLVSQVKDGTVAGKTTWRDPSDVVLHLKPAGATTVPAGNFGFLGPAGSKIWQIPQTQNSSMLWLGWNTEEITSSQLRGASLTWSLDKVEGPGKLVIYLFETFGQPRVVFDSGNGLPDRYTVATGTHAHGNWAFTKEGAYKLTFTQRATLANGRLVSDTATVTFAVGSTDPQSLARRTSSRTYTYSGTSCGPLALTGTSLVGPVALGAGLLVGGGLLVVLTIRRRRAS